MLVAASLAAKTSQPGRRQVPGLQAVDERLFVHHCALWPITDQPQRGRLDVFAQEASELPAMPFRGPKDAFGL
jgi:hypothetical protein